MSKDDDIADWDALDIEDEAASTGAAADSVDLDDQLAKLPRLLRYLVLADKNAKHLEERLIGEINVVSPGLAQTAAWANAWSVKTGKALAAVLDRRAVSQDQPILRSLADCVRLLSMPLPRDSSTFADYRRVGKALIDAARTSNYDGNHRLAAQIEAVVYGWAALPVATETRFFDRKAVHNATTLGRTMAARRINSVEIEMRRAIKEDAEAHETREQQKRASGHLPDSHATDTPGPSTPLDHVLVARVAFDDVKSTRLKDVMRPHAHAINVPLPLVPIPVLHEVRKQLMFEFPYAQDVIDNALADLIGRTSVHFNPILIVGAPGSGKSRFARRLAEILGLHIWRTDASRADGGTFGGTDRRWSTAEPCHPFLAVSRGKIGNPAVLIDEIEKAATRNDYGRLWDALLGFLEPETARCYPDPALQTDLDLSHVSYIATANAIEPLPGPITDRFRILTFPTPSVDDLDALLPAILVDLARERGLQAHWIPPLNGDERAAAASFWRGGSVRSLRRVVETLVRYRESQAKRN